MIFDLTIPKAMGGKDAIPEIRKLAPRIPVFVASGIRVNTRLQIPEIMDLPLPFASHLTVQNL